MFRISPRLLVPPLVLLAITATACSSDDQPFNSVDAIAPPGVSVADYFDLPASAAGPTIPEVGYLVEEINDGVYWITEGTYQLARCSSVLYAINHCRENVNKPNF